MRKRAALTGWSLETESVQEVAGKAGDVDKLHPESIGPFLQKEASKPGLVNK